MGKTKRVIRRHGSIRRRIKGGMHSSDADRESHDNDDFAKLSKVGQSVSSLTRRRTIRQDRRKKIEEKMRGLKMPRGAFYEGEYSNGKPHGMGKLTLRNGTVYIGPFKHGEKGDGYGVINHASGTKYEGNVKDGLPHGRGKMIRPDGSFYEGEFANGKRHGKGKETFRNGLQTIEGTFKNDEPQKVVTTWHPRLIYPKYNEPLGPPGVYSGAYIEDDVDVDVLSEETTD